MSLYYIDINSVMVARNPSSVPVIGSNAVYTITCEVTISCTGLCRDTLISWSLNGNRVTSATHTESNNLPFTISSSGTFTSTLTTVGDISISHAGEYQCSASNTGISVASTTDYYVECKLYVKYIIANN